MYTEWGEGGGWREERGGGSLASTVSVGMCCWLLWAGGQGLGGTEAGGFKGEFLPIS